jgi:hypothetical protein
VTEPIACSLAAGELSARLAQIAAVGRDGLLDADVSQRVAVLRFRADVRARLEAVVAAEAECCAFLAMSLRDGGEAVELRIEAPEGAEAVLRDLAATFGAQV